MQKFFTRKNEKGATIIEYVLIAALLSIVAIAILGTLGTDVSQAFGSVEAGIDGSAGG